LLRELADPNLHDIPTHLPFRVEMWDRHDQHVRRVMAASFSVAIGHAALDAAINNYPGQRFTLRNGILVIREHVPTG
jgi:predicted double-glycine peptidase